MYLVIQESRLFLNLTFVPDSGIIPPRKHGKGPRCLISDLGQFDFENGRMRLTTFHPGMTIEKIQAHTGFPLEVSPAVMETAAPTDVELGLLRHEIDPLNIRRLETLSGPARRELLHRIIEVEQDNHSIG